MRWNRYRLKTSTEAVDVVAATLAEVGIEGVEIEDHQPLTEEELGAMFVDIPLIEGEDDGTAWVSFYLDADEDQEETLAKVREALDELREFMEIGDGVLEESQTEDKDWINNWKEYFHQFYVDDILIIPSWEEMKEEDRDKMVIHIDPGTAFGTGMHETTQLCLRQLKKYICPETLLLDVGTGSGILSIAALKMGARQAWATDLDPNALSAVEENLEANGLVPDQMPMLIGNLIDDPEVQSWAGSERFDIVAANILAEVLVMLTPQIPVHLKRGGIYITSGILQEKEDLVRSAIEQAGMEVAEITHQGEWSCITARKV